MKRHTPDHPKLTALMRALKIRRYIAVGLLEMLWHSTARFAHQGDIGRFDNQAIADILDYPGDAGVLIEALVLTGWLERCGTHRLVVHDWASHCDAGVRNALKYRGLSFVKSSPNVEPGFNPSSTLVEPRFNPGSTGISRASAAPSRAVRHNLQEQDQQQEDSAASLSTIRQSATETSNLSAKGGGDAVDTGTTGPMLLASSPREEAARLRVAFQTFWAAYPARNGRRDGKRAALEVWMRLKPTSALLGGILTALDAYTASTDLPCDAVRWLKGRRWEDEAVFIADLEPQKPKTVFEKPADGGAMARLIRAGALAPKGGKV